MLPSRADKPSTVRRMFDAIAPRYDLLNHVFSLNVDRRWRRIAVDALIEIAGPSGSFLDACAGTMDLALELARRPAFSGRVEAVDFSTAMLQQGLPKLDDAAVDPICGDALALPFKDKRFDGATVGFGVRNLAGLDAGLDELARVLRPGAPLVVLEFTTPDWKPFRKLYMFYFQRVMPWIGARMSSDDRAYAYLPASVLEFPGADELAGRIRAAGFVDVEWQSLTGGIAAVHSAVRA